MLGGELVDNWDLGMFVFTWNVIRDTHIFVYIIIIGYEL